MKVLLLEKRTRQKNKPTARDNFKMGLISGIKQSYLDGRKARNLIRERSFSVGAYGRLLHNFGGFDNEFNEKFLDKARDKLSVELYTIKERLEILERQSRGFLESLAYNFGLYGQLNPDPLNKLLPNL